MSSSKPKKLESALKSPAKASTSTEKIVQAQNPDAPVTKRLHISGLTPAITLDDLNKRLSTFGSVEAVDGMGKLDALGRPRTFAYVTLNTNVGKLSRCMNVLSGSTWKGAKLRIGEAKPDYRERLATEREASAALEDQPKRKRQRVDGFHASDMSPVTPEVAANKSGWKVTEMGRVLRTVRMRPDHPLPPTLEEKTKAKSAVAATAGTHYTKGKKVSGKDGKDEDKRKRKKDPPVRARRITIDVTKWESSLLKGMFLESQGAVSVGAGGKGDIVEEAGEESSEEDGSESEEEDEEMDAVIHEEEEKQKPTPRPIVQSAPPPPPKPSVPTPQPAPVAAASTFKTLATDSSDPASSIAHEKSAALSLLSSLFGNADDEDDWVVQDALDSDIDEEEILKTESKARENVVRSGVNVSKGDVEFEVVPREKGPAGVKRKADEVMNEEEEEARQVTTQKEATPVPEKKEESKLVLQAAPNLKDLFAPREEEAGFSLLGHLDLDLEVDEELAFAIEGTTTTAPAASSYTATPAVSLPTPATASQAAASIYINPRESMFFFPFPSSMSSHTTSAMEWKNLFHHLNSNKKTKDALDVMVDNGWYWRDPKVAFYRTESEEDIRKRWEEKRSDLTKGWKRRAREAGKVGRRRKGVRGGEEEV